ncbi:hypothetical protein RJ55_04446 [Drechmeria coniospora]|nr:hypothetical protein RJ55_04446 [Drechmeria coniospora]
MALAILRTGTRPGFAFAAWTQCAAPDIDTYAYVCSTVQYCTRSNFAVGAFPLALGKSRSTSEPCLHFDGIAGAQLNTTTFTCIADERALPACGDLLKAAIVSTSKRQVLYQHGRPTSMVDGVLGLSVMDDAERQGGDRVLGPKEDEASTHPGSDLQCSLISGT